MKKFSGIQKTTLIDYPGEVACTLFVGGCNFRCPYCYNQDLVFDRDTGVSISQESALDFLKDRRSFLDGVCITGGEPLVHLPEIIDFIRSVKKLNYKVKIDTNGSFPDALQNLINEKLVDYIAMDIKGPKEKYNFITKTEVDMDKIGQSAAYIMNSKNGYEFRTTASTLLDLNDFIKIGEWLKGAKKYFLQHMNDNVPLLNKDEVQKPISKEELYMIKDKLNPFFMEVGVRS